MQLVTADQRRVSTTPNATMTTLASPTLGGADARVWLVQMAAGAVGPVHAFAEEVVWAITAGTADLDADDRTQPLAAGDTVVLPGGILRRFTAGPEGFHALATTRGTGEVVRDDGRPGAVPPWVA